MSMFRVQRSGKPLTEPDLQWKRWVLTDTLLCLHSLESPCRLHVLWWNAQHRNRLNILHELETTWQSNLSLLMRVLLIAGQPIVAVPGQSEEPRHNARPFLYAVDSKDIINLFWSCWQLYSYSALSLWEGILHCSIVEGSFCTESFTQFITQLLDNMQPFPPKILSLWWTIVESTSTLISRNSLNLGKNNVSLDFACWSLSRGMHCEYLPPYFPNFNPIELAFSAMKYSITSAKMVITHKWPWYSWQSRMLTSCCLVLYIRLLLRIHMVGSCTVVTYDSTTVDWLWYD